LTFEIRWLKIGDKRYEHQTQTPGNEAGTGAESQLGELGGASNGSSNTLMTTPYFGEDATLSEMSEEGSSSSKDDSASESNIVFESVDLDETGILSSVSHSQSQTSQTIAPGNQNQKSTIASSATTTESLGNGSGTAEGGASFANSTAPSIEVISHDSSSGAKQVAFDPAPTTKTMRMRKQNSHGDVRSAELRQAGARSTVDLSSLQKNGPIQDSRIFSASASVLPEYQIDSSSGYPSTLSGTSTPPIPGLSTTPTTAASDGGGGLLSQVRARGRSVAAAFMGAGKTAITNSAPARIASPEPVSAPFVSYVDKDGPELPQSAQSSLVYLAPNSFAIQSAAISGDEVARLRAETMDKNFKISLLGKQVEVLEKKLADTSNKLVEVQKRDTAQLSEITSLEKKLRRARRAARNAAAGGNEESTMDDESTTSSGGGAGGDQSRGSSTSTSGREGGTGKKKRTKKRSRSEAAIRTPLARPLWTPERERVGLLTIVSLIILIAVILCSSQVRTTLFVMTGMEGLSPLLGSAPVHQNPSDPSPAMVEAGHALTTAFANALNVSIPPAEG
jgi:hypothetical protein